MSDQQSSSNVPLSWIVLFMLLALGLGASAILAVGGDLLATIAPV
jgi:hypothetical protein